MSLPGASKTCLRNLCQSNRANPCANSWAVTYRASRRNFHAPTPLFLDFLAPSWRKSTVPARQPLRTTSLHPVSRRSISTTAPRGAKAITNPRQNPEGEEMTITITPRAAHRLQTIAETDDNPGLVLRVSVESGGCHGFQYLMSLTSVDAVDASEDTLFENDEAARPKVGGEATYKAKVVMDEASLELLHGSKVDYTMELIGSQFKVTGIPGAKSSCGCGTSFDIAA